MPFRDEARVLLMGLIRANKLHLAVFRYAEILRHVKVSDRSHEPFTFAEFSRLLNSLCQQDAPKSNAPSHPLTVNR